MNDPYDFDDADRVAKLLESINEHGRKSLEGRKND